jgi:hypothetical protein
LVRRNRFEPGQREWLRQRRFYSRWMIV